jgi:hypothetical protein
LPLFEFACDDDSCGVQTEKLMLLREYEAGEKPPCATCGGPMHRIYLPSYQRAGAAFKAIVIDERPDGTYSFPMSDAAPVADGAIRRSITSFAEADRVMRRVNDAERRIADAHTENQQRWLEHSESASRSDLRNGFTYQDHDGKTRTAPPLHQMSPLGRAFAEYVMRQNDAKARPRTREPGVMLEIREMDQSNREGYRDLATGWRNRRD